MEKDPVTGVTRFRVSVHGDRKMWAAIASVLRDERRARGLTTRQVAEMAGHVTPQYVGQVERGKSRPAVDTLVRILSALELAPILAEDGRTVDFYADQGLTHITVELRPTPFLQETATPEWKAEQDAEDIRKIGEIVSALARDRDFLLSAYRVLGFDEAYNLETDRAEAWAENLRELRRGN